MKLADLLRSCLLKVVEAKTNFVCHLIVTALIKERAADICEPTDEAIRCQIMQPMNIFINYDCAVYLFFFVAAKSL